MTSAVSGTVHRRLLVEGWRFLPHSYALVAQAHCLCIARHADVDLHGVDPLVFRPDEASRRATREALGVRDAFVYLSVGAMTWNKGLDVLLAAFARVIESEPDIRLVLKGTDALYPSRELVGEVLGDLPAGARETVIARLIYEGRTFSAKALAGLLR